jgi:hypothetical protein
MRINHLKVRDLYESKGRTAGGKIDFLNDISHGLGLTDRNGVPNKSSSGNSILKTPKIRPEQFSIQELAEAIIGPSWRQYFDPANSGAMAKHTISRSVVESRFPNQSRALFEATGVGIDPTAFSNINAFSAVVGGLIEVKILEAFQNPSLIADTLMPSEATKLNGQKIIGVNRLGDLGKRRQPGEPHQRAQFNERWIETPETRENALAVDILKETVFFDLTGDLLNVASSVGEELAYRKELECIDTFIGVTNSFKYNGTAYDTYRTSKTLGYLNDHVNIFADWQSVQATNMKFARMEDPATAKRLLITPNTILVNPAKVATANIILGANLTERRVAIAGETQSNTNALSVSQTPGNPYSGQYTILSSPLVEMRCTDSTGLNLSQAYTDDYWWMFESGKTFKYMQNYPLTVMQAAPNQYEMIDKGIIASYFANERGIPSVWSPWHIVRNKAA